MPIIHEGRNAWRTGHADHAGVLVDARDYYVAFYKAALGARRHILLSGWQFDSGVQLLRGDDVALAREEGGHTKLLDVLNHLCETRPDLEISILAWDFHVVLAFEREWLQRLLFEWNTNERLRFRFDNCHPDQASHHQKFALIDGHTAFVGGIDLCEARWDDRRHDEDNPLRLSRDRPQKPYHDTQAYVVGRRAVAPLVRLFESRWKRSCGHPIEVHDVPDGTPAPHPPPGALPLPPGPFALSRTDPQDAEKGEVREIATLYADAITAAERLVYIETQYFSSHEIRDALERRMRDARRPRLEIVLVLNERAEAFKEQLAVGLRQAENLGRLRAAAAETGHHLGVYFTVARGPGIDPRKGSDKRTYIHTKLMIVDDTFLTIGSANLTNRSMGLDTELNLSWEADATNAALSRAIRRVRVSLLAEHGGFTTIAEVRRLARRGGLVAALDASAGAASRLRLHPSPTEAEREEIEIVNPQALPFDPARPHDDAVDDANVLRVDLHELWLRLTNSP